MNKIILISTLLAFVGCSSTSIQHAEIKEATFNTATWKSQAGVGKDASIQATTSPKTDAEVAGL